MNCLNLYLKVLLKINFVELSEYASYLHIKINTQFDLKKKRKVLASRRTYPSKGFFGKSSNKGPATEESALHLPGPRLMEAEPLEAWRGSINASACDLS